MSADGNTFVVAARRWVVAIAVGVATAGCASTGNRPDGLNYPDATDVNRGASATDKVGSAAGKGAVSGVAGGAMASLYCGPFIVICLPAFTAGGLLVGAAGGAIMGSIHSSSSGGSIFTSSNSGWRVATHKQIDIVVGRTNGVPEEFAAGEVHVLEIRSIEEIMEVPRLAWLKVLPDHGASQLLDAAAHCDTGVLDVKVRQYPPRENAKDIEFHTRQLEGRDAEPVWSKVAEVICSATE
jgi:hypothetical protein